MHLIKIDIIVPNSGFLLNLVFIELSANVEKSFQPIVSITINSETHPESFRFGC